MPDPDPSVIAIHIEPDRMDRLALQGYRGKQPAMRLLGHLQTLVLGLSGGLVGGVLFSSEWRRGVGLLILLTVVALVYGLPLARQMRLEVQTHRVDVHATERGLTIIRLIGPTETIEWDDLSDITVTPSHLLARWSPVREVLLPRRCLADQSQWDQLCRWATRDDPRWTGSPTSSAVTANPRIWQRRQDVTR